MSSSAKAPWGTDRNLRDVGRRDLAEEDVDPIKVAVPPVVLVGGGEGCQG